MRPRRQNCPRAEIPTTAELQYHTTHSESAIPLSMGHIVLQNLTNACD